MGISMTNPLATSQPQTNPATTPAASAASTSASATSSLANQNTFLQLLVAQLQNQDPLNPQDGTQFVSQLAQLSELQQVISINQGVSTIATDLNSAQAASSSSASTTPASTDSSAVPPANSSSSTGSNSTASS
jgi:flagellar basal-body rod modification protein FlgD